jgi:hypothetical protein
MKTNHFRNFVGDDDRPNWGGNMRKYGVGYGDATNGHRGQARQKAGLKKFIRTRRRFAEKFQTKQIADAVAAGIET